MDLEPLQLILFIVAGVGTGIINTLAGSGSLVTLPIFMFICGMDANLANGTNRVGVLFQSAVGVAGFNKHGNLPLAGVGWMVVPAIIGAIAGSLIAVEVDKQIMYYTIGGLMVFMLFVLFLKPKRWIRITEADPSVHKRPINILVYFLIGVYGGFIQAGVGIFLLAALVMVSKYDLIKSNGVKLLIVLIFSIPALLIFMWNNQVHWGYGLMMAAAQSVGAFLGARFANKIPNAQVYIRWLLIVIVVVSAVKMLGIWDWVVSLI